MSKADNAAWDASTSTPQPATAPRRRGTAKKKILSSELVKEDKGAKTTGDEETALGESLDIASVISHTIGGIEIVQNSGKGKGKGEKPIKTNDEAVLVDQPKEISNGTQGRQDLNTGRLDEAGYTQ